MNTQTQPAPLLVFAYGNPSRGDDALGPAMYDLLERDRQTSSELDQVDLLTDYQLQIEHAIDLEQRDYVLFVDASVSCTPPWALQKIEPQRDHSYTSHAMSPAALLTVYEQINRQQAPASYMLSIRGYEFGLGQDLSAQAASNLQQAYEQVKKLIKNNVENRTAMHVT